MSLLRRVVGTVRVLAQVRRQRFYWSQAFLPIRRLALSPYDPLDENLARLDGFRPHVIAGGGSHTGALFRLFLEGRIRFRLPKAVVFGGDPFPERVRTRLETEHGIPVFSCYGATEAPRIGFSCEERRGLHLHADLCHVTVLLNYRLGDRGAFDGRTCPRRRPLPLLDGMIGRVDEAILLPDGRFVTRFDLYPVLRSRTDLLEYQLAQTADDVVCIRVVPDVDADFARIEREVREGFQALVGDRVRVDVERVEVIPRRPGGKVAVISALLGS